MPSFRIEPLPTDRHVLVVQGDLDLATAHELTSAAAPLVADARLGDPALRLDLAGVTFLDSTGVGALLEVHSSAVAGGGRVEVISMSPVVERVLELTGLLTVLTGTGKPS